MDFGTNKNQWKQLEKEYLQELILEIRILVLMVNGIESHGNNFMN